MKSQRGYSVIEILTVIAMSIVLATVLVVALHPSKTLSDVRTSCEKFKDYTASQVKNIPIRCYDYLGVNSFPSTSVIDSFTPPAKTGIDSCYEITGNIGAMQACEDYYRNQKSY